LARSIDRAPLTNAVRSGLKIDLLLEEKLVLVTTNPEAHNLDGSDYVYMDWGPDFVLHHGMDFPEVAPDLFF